jgi:DNA-directed RNA polymerase specialized sigma24 family protein
MSRHLVLQQSEFDALLTFLAPGREQAAEKYEDIRHTLIRYFEGHQCLPADEHVDETMDRVARRVAAGERIRSANPIRYFYGVARHVILERRKHQPVLQQSCETVAIFQATPPPHLPCLNCCLSALTPRGRELLEAYYLDSRAGLAAREGVTANALRLRVFREKQKLRTCIARCLQPIGADVRHTKYPAAKRH